MIEMTAIQLRQRLTSSGNTTPVLLDVREEWEYQYCHIENSVLIPMGEISQKLHDLDPQRETVVICHHGIRSRRIGHYLETQNFTHIINLTGGVEAWADTVDPAMPRY